VESLGGFKQLHEGFAVLQNIETPILPFQASVVIQHISHSLAAHNKHTCK